MNRPPDIRLSNVPAAPGVGFFFRLFLQAAGVFSLGCIYHVTSMSFGLQRTTGFTRFSLATSLFGWRTGSCLVRWTLCPATDLLVHRLYGRGSRWTLEQSTTFAILSYAASDPPLDSVIEANIHMTLLALVLQGQSSRKRPPSMVRVWAL